MTAPAHAPRTHPRHPPCPRPDVSDDVRRAAVMCLGFVLMNVPEQCPRIVSLLAESYNPHVR